MADISEELAVIQSNVYGDEVRSAIIVAVDKINTELEADVVEIQASLQEIQQRIDDL